MWIVGHSRRPLCKRNPRTVLQRPGGVPKPRVPPPARGVDQHLVSGRQFLVQIDQTARQSTTGLHGVVGGRGILHVQDNVLARRSPAPEYISEKGVDLSFGATGSVVPPEVVRPPQDARIFGPSYMKEQLVVHSVGGHVIWRFCCLVRS